MYHEKPMVAILRNRAEEESIFQGVQNCLGHAGRKNPETISRSTAISEIAEDSLGRIEAICEVETSLNIDMDDALYDEIKTVGDLVEALVYGRILPKEDSIPVKSGWRRLIPTMHLKRAS